MYSSLALNATAASKNVTDKPHATTALHEGYPRCASTWRRRKPISPLYLQDGPLTNARFPRRQIRSSRIRRVVSGSEVTLTPESINALADRTLALEVSMVHNADMDLHFPSMTVDDDAIERITDQFSPSLDFGTTLVTQSLPIRPGSPNVASGLRSPLDLTFLGGMDPFSSLPFEAFEETSLTRLLVHYCKCPSNTYTRQMLTNVVAVRIAPWLSYLDDSLTESSPRVSWLPYALNHPPLFHATLLVAAVHLDRRQPLKDSSAMLRLKVQTIRLANENMDGTPEGVSDQMMMVALILLYFNVSLHLPHMQYARLTERLGWWR